MEEAIGEESASDRSRWRAEPCRHGLHPRCAKAEAIPPRRKGHELLPGDGRYVRNSNQALAAVRVDRSRAWRSSSARRVSMTGDTAKACTQDPTGTREEPAPSEPARRAATGSASREAQRWGAISRREERRRCCLESGSTSRASPLQAPRKPTSIDLGMAPEVSFATSNRFGTPGSSKTDHANSPPAHPAV